jgi:hypothetical protein
VRLWFKRGSLRQQLPLRERYPLGHPDAPLWRILHGIWRIVRA